MATKDQEKKKELARVLFFNFETQAAIADKVGVSKVTANKWISASGWKEQRAAKAVTRPELVNKVLQNIATLLDNASNPDKEANPDIADKLAKLASAVSKLDKKANVVDCVDVFISFHTWLSNRSEFDKKITPELIKQINALQDQYVSERMNIQS